MRASIFGSITGSILAIIGLVALGQTASTQPTVVIPSTMGGFTATDSAGDLVTGSVATITPAKNIPRPAITITAAPTYAGQSLFVKSTGTYGSGNADDSALRWDFTDSTGAVSTLYGYSAAHEAAAPGPLSVKLTVANLDGSTASVSQTITIQADNRPVVAIGTSVPVLTSGVRYQFRGETDISAQIPLNNLSNTSFEGVGPIPVIKWTGKLVGYAGIIHANSACTNISILNLGFDSVFPSTAAANAPDAIDPQGSNWTIAGCTTGNIALGIQGNASPSNVNITSNNFGLSQAQTIWAQGANWCVAGNKFAGSHAQATERIGGADFVNVSNNSISTGYDSGLVAQLGSYLSCFNNTINGTAGVGPLDQSEYTAAQLATIEPFNHARFEGNTITGAFTVNAGAKTIRLRNNIFPMPGNSMAIGIVGTSGTWRADDMGFYGTAMNLSSGGYAKLIQVFSEPAPKSISGSGNSVNGTAINISGANEGFITATSAAGFGVWGGNSFSTPSGTDHGLGTVVYLADHQPSNSAPFGQWIDDHVWNGKTYAGWNTIAGANPKDVLK